MLKFPMFAVDGDVCWVKLKTFMERVVPGSSVLTCLPFFFLPVSLRTVT